MAGADGFADAVAEHFVGEIEMRLREAHLTASNAKSFSSQGLQDRAVETLLNVEPLIFEARALLEALTIVRRSRSH